jgi:hypothetical protein
VSVQVFFFCPGVNAAGLPSFRFTRAALPFPSPSLSLHILFILYYLYIYIYLLYFIYLYLYYIIYLLIFIYMREYIIYHVVSVLCGTLTKRTKQMPNKMISSDFNAPATTKQPCRINASFSKQSDAHLID